MNNDSNPVLTKKWSHILFQEDLFDWSPPSASMMHCVAISYIICTNGIKDIKPKQQKQVKKKSNCGKRADWHRSAQLIFQMQRNIKPVYRPATNHIFTALFTGPIIICNEKICNAGLIRMHTLDYNSGFLRVRKIKIQQTEKNSCCFELIK